MQEELYDEVWGLLHKVQHLLHRAREMELENDGLSTVAAGVLSFVDGSKKPVTPSMLSRYLHRQPHTISGLVSRMEKQGLVKKVKDLERKNQVHVTLTTKGKRLAQKLDKRPVAFNALSTLSEQELTNMAKYLNKLMKSGAEQLRSMQPLPYSSREL
jgi:DNA-binding MarR family transcriptional regulator